MPPTCSPYNIGAKKETYWYRTNEKEDNVILADKSSILGQEANFLSVEANRESSSYSKIQNHVRHVKTRGRVSP